MAERSGGDESGGEKVGGFVGVVGEGGDEESGFWVRCESGGAYY